MRWDRGPGDGTTGPRARGVVSQPVGHSFACPLSQVSRATNPAVL
jgi:hypothetical protein